MVSQDPRRDSMFAVGVLTMLAIFSLITMFVPVGALIQHDYKPLSCEHQKEMGIWIVFFFFLTVILAGIAAGVYYYL